MKESVYQRCGSMSCGTSQTSQRKTAYALEDNRESSVQRQPQVTQKNDTGLPDNLKAGIESLSGYSMDDVTVHYNSSKPATLQAHAYAQGTDIHLASGQEQHLPHEAWHVVQQKQGRVKPTMQMNGGVEVNDNAGLEQEADHMGTKASQVGDKHLALKTVGTQLQHVSAAIGQSNPVQGVFIVNGTYVSRTVLREKKAEIMRDTKLPLAERGFDEISPTQWSHIFEQLMILAQSGIEFHFSRTSEAIAEILKGMDAESMIQQHQEQAEKSITGNASSNGVRDIPRLSLSNFKEARSSTAFLNEMRPKTDTSGWNGEHDQLKDAHHKIGKNVLAWLYDHMDAKSQREVKQSLHLDFNAQALALTRLGSNLISPEVQGRGRVAKSDSRRDDPMNNSRESRVGEEYLDLMRDNSGSLTPRSRVFSSLADNVVRNIFERFRLHQGSGERFVLNEEEVAAIIQHLREAEMINFQLEGDPSKPSHSSGDAWDDVTQGEPRPKFKKRQVEPVNIQDEQLANSYDIAAQKKLSASLTKKKQLVSEKIMSFRQWLSLESDIHEDPYELYDMYDEYVITERKSDLNSQVDDLISKIRLFNKFFPTVVGQAAVRLRAELQEQTAQLDRAGDSNAAEAMYIRFKARLAAIAEDYI